MGQNQSSHKELAESEQSQGISRIRTVTRDQQNQCSHKGSAEFEQSQGISRISAVTRNQQNQSSHKGSAKLIVSAVNMDQKSKLHIY